MLPRAHDMVMHVWDLVGMSSISWLPLTETNGQKFLRRPGSTKGCQTNDDDGDDDDSNMKYLRNNCVHFVGIVL
jgi:hypothetical protein